MVAEVIDRPVEEAPEGKIRIDGEFLKEQASEAITTFFAPLLGVYAAATGKRIVVKGRRKSPKKKAA
jgi:hypothetical protein